MSQRSGAQRKQSQASAPQAAMLMRVPIGPEGTPGLADVGAPPIVQEAAPAPASDRAPESLQEQLAEAPAGESLDSGARQFLEPRFGHSFGDIRVHADGEADRMARTVDANAFTHGQDIFFRSGMYDPSSPRGLQLIAHEAAHTIQQPASGREETGESLTISTSSDYSERQASQVAAQAVAGGAVDTGMLGTVSDAGLIQRLPDAGTAALGPGAASAVAPPAGSAPQSSVLQPTSYGPPAKFAGKLPDTGYGVNIDASPVNEAIKNLPWAKQTKDNMTWQGWSEIDALTQPGFLARNLGTATNGVLSQPLKPDAGTLMNYDYRIEIRARLEDLKYISADGVMSTQIGASGATLQAAGQTSSGQSASLTAGKGGEGKPSLGGEIGLENAQQQGSSVQLTGTTQRITSAQATVLFSCAVQLDIIVYRVSHVTTVGLVGSLGVAGAISALAGDRTNSVNITTTATVRMLVSECTPQYSL